MENGVVVQFCLLQEGRVVMLCEHAGEFDVARSFLALSGTAPNLRRSSGRSWLRKLSIVLPGSRFFAMCLCVLCSGIFRGTYRTTLSEWLGELRLAKAYERIRAGESVKFVAFELGFKQLSHFSRAFKEAHGVPPRLIAAQFQSPLAKLLSTELPSVNFLPRASHRSAPFESVVA
jgi:hypothetical protein